MVYDDEAKKNLFNLFACLAHVHDSFNGSYVVILDNREISVKEVSVSKWD
jgi:hypothetical protein